MDHLFRTFIETSLFNSHKTSSSHHQQITIEKICTKLQKLMHKSLTQSTGNQMTLSKIGTNLEKDNKNQVKTENLDKNDLYIESLKEITTFIFKLAYGHPCLFFYPKYKIQNVIGFYQISKWIYSSDLIFTSSQLKRNFNQQVIGLLFTQKIMVYKDVYYRIEESSVFKNFVDELFYLIKARAKQFFNHFGLNINPQLIKTCESHVRSIIQVYQMTDSMRFTSIYGLQESTMMKSTIRQKQMMFESKNLLSSTQIQSEQYLNTISIDEILIFFVFIVYRLSHEYTNISMCKLVDVYYEKILRWNKYKKNDRIMDLYNNCYLKLFVANKLERIDKSQINFISDKAQQFLAPLVQNGTTILDNFVSSFQS